MSGQAIHTYNPQASLNDMDIRRVNGASVVFGSGGMVTSCKLVDDYSAVRIDGLGPNQVRGKVLKKILRSLDVYSLADKVKHSVTDDDETDSIHVLVVGDNPDFAYKAMRFFRMMSEDQREKANISRIRLSLATITLDDIDEDVPLAPHLPFCTPRFRDQCSICTDDLDEEQFVGSCGHTWCLPCFTSWAECSSAFDQKGALVCDRQLGDCDCNNAFTLAEMKDQLSPDTYEKLLQNSALSYIKKRPKEFRPCPHAGCEQVYRPRTDPDCFQCTGCDGTICPSCEGGHGEDTPCKVDTELEQAKKEMGAKKCPACKTIMTKSDGCNHMICFHCKTDICWVCMATFGHADLCYKHLRTVHGSIDGVTMVDADGVPIIDEDMAAQDEAARAELAGGAAPAGADEEENEAFRVQLTWAVVTALREIFPEPAGADEEEKEAFRAQVARIVEAAVAETRGTAAPARADEENEAFRDLMGRILVTVLVQEFRWTAQVVAEEEGEVEQVDEAAFVQWLESEEEADRAEAQEEAEEAGDEATFAQWTPLVGFWAEDFEEE